MSDHFDKFASPKNQWKSSLIARNILVVAHNAVGACVVCLLERRSVGNGRCRPVNSLAAKRRNGLADLRSRGFWRRLPHRTRGADVASLEIVQLSRRTDLPDADHLELIHVGLCTICVQPAAYVLRWKVAQVFISC